MFPFSIFLFIIFISKTSFLEKTEQNIFYRKKRGGSGLGCSAFYHTGTRKIYARNWNNTQTRGISETRCIPI